MVPAIAPTRPSEVAGPREAGEANEIALGMSEYVGAFVMRGQMLRSGWPHVWHHSLGPEIIRDLTRLMKWSTSQ